MDRDTWPDPEPPTRGQRSETRHRRRVRWTMALFFAGTILAAAWLFGSMVREQQAGQPVAATILTAPPPACARALATAGKLAGNADALAEAASHHRELMERLDLFLEGRPGGLSGHQVYEQGAAQMQTFADRGPKAQAEVRRLRRELAACQPK